MASAGWYAHGLSSLVSLSVFSLSPCCLTPQLLAQHFALQQAGVRFEVVQALDVNEVANAVYTHNFPSVPVNRVVALPPDKLPTCADLLSALRLT